MLQTLQATEEVDERDLKNEMLYDLSIRLTELGDFENAIIATTTINSYYFPYERSWGIFDIFLRLATEPVTESGHIQDLFTRRLKKSFTAEEQEIAKQFVESISNQ